MTEQHKASDASYHRRHTRRSEDRARCISARIAGPVDVLDVGCNVGITSKYLLEARKAKSVTGIELSASTVSDELRRDSRFTLIEGNIATVDPRGPYHVVIYGAVHHHVLHHHGLGSAISVLRKLADSCTASLFFETGQLTEGGRWPWQRTLRKYFRSDEEHFCYLATCLEDLTTDFDIIGRFRIHGISRAYLQFDLKPPEERCPVTVPGDVVALAGPPSPPTGRTFGSRGQRLVPVDKPEALDSPTQFAEGTGSDGQQVFLKRHLHNPQAAAKEAFINRQVRHGWAVPVLGCLADGATLVFPLLRDFVTVSELTSLAAIERRRAATELLRVFEESGTTLIELPRSRFMSHATHASLSNVCDINPNNLLFVKEGDRLLIRVVDFEQQGCRYLWKNRINVGRTLLRLRCNRSRAITELALGVMGFVWLAVDSQFLSLKERIVLRQPGIISILVTAVRSTTGSLFGRTLRFFGVH